MVACHLTLYTIQYSDDATGGHHALHHGWNTARRGGTRVRTAADLERPTATAPATVRELYRTAAPIPDLKKGGYDLNLTQVTFPAHMPSNPPHHRSGGALYYIVSGTGANTVDGKTEAKGPGSLIYEPYGLVHQWGNPGNAPLTFVSFNINQEGFSAVLPGAPVKTQ
jgi:quercetin dioxygenase-like cupin family protein